MPKKNDTTPMQTADGRFTATHCGPSASGLWVIEGPGVEDAVGTREEAQEKLAKLGKKQRKKATKSTKRARVCDGSGVRVPLTLGEATRATTTVWCSTCRRQLSARVGRETSGWPAATIPRHHGDV